MMPYHLSYMELPSSTGVVNGGSIETQQNTEAVVYASQFRTIGVLQLGFIAISYGGTTQITIIYTQRCREL